jgi:hypothetical protein
METSTADVSFATLSPGFVQAFIMGMAPNLNIHNRYGHFFSHSSPSAAQSDE